jgi:hypothetical protein
MKNRRLNVLFIAIIALAAAPQALLDAHRLANAAQERFEVEFWNVFLSYQMPGASGAAESRLVPAVNKQESACPFENAPAQQPATVAVKSRSTDTQLRSSAEARRARDINIEPQKAEVAASDEEVAQVDEVPTVELSAKELKALRDARLHSRDTERAADAASRASIASFMQNNQELRIKMKEATEMDKLLRQRTRSLKERGADFDNIPTPPATDGSM